MKIYKIAEPNTTAYRICIMRQNPKNGKNEVRSLYRKNYNETIIYTPIEVGKKLIGRYYVATKRKYCEAYFSGNTDLLPGEREVLLTVRVENGILPDTEEDSYMGSETVATNPIILNIEYC